MYSYHICAWVGVPELSKIPFRDKYSAMVHKFCAKLPVLIANNNKKKSCYTKIEIRVVSGKLS